MADPKTVHLWLPDNRSLCDRRARPGRSAGPEEDLASLKVEEAAPVCGACALVLYVLRGDLAVAELVQPGFWPDTPAKAWKSLRGTRWENQLAIDRRPPVSQLKGLATDQIDPNRLQELAEEERLRLQSAIEELQEEIASTLE